MSDTPARKAARRIVSQQREEREVRRLARLLAKIPETSRNYPKYLEQLAVAKARVAKTKELY